MAPFGTYNEQDTHSGLQMKPFVQHECKGAPLNRPITSQRVTTCVKTVSLEGVDPAREQKNEVK